MIEEKKAPESYSFTMEDGGTFSGVDKKLHSVDDQPAVVYANGTKWWYKNGKVHRDGNKPAVIWENGTMEWFIDGMRHRTDGGPTVVYGEGAHPMLRGHSEWHVMHKLVRKTHNMG